MEKKQISEKEKKKENFIMLLASMTPEEVNKMILEKGKEAKLIDPLIPIID